MMDAEEFEQTSISLLEALANDSQEIHIKHKRALGALDLGGLLATTASRQIINQYTFTLSNAEDFDRAFGYFLTILEVICQAYIEKKAPGKKFRAVDWDVPEGEYKHRLVGVELGYPLPNKDYDLYGYPQKREILLSSEDLDFDTTLYSFMRYWAVRSGYKVMVQPGKDPEKEADKPRAPLLKRLFWMDGPEPAPEPVAYIPISEFHPPAIGEETYLLTGFLTTIEISR
jgi:hypothetical protein